MSFVYPSLLLLLWLAPLPGLYLIWARRRRQRLASFLVHPNALVGRKNQNSNSIFYVQLSLFVCALVLFVIAAAQPRWGEREEIVLNSGRNVLIVLDVSRSMLAADVHPNRLERAKADISDLLSELQGDRVGIMVFRKGSVLLCPFTTDAAYLSQTLSGISIESAPRGETDIGEAITAGLETFKNLGADHNAIILISDGEDLSGKAVARATDARERGIPVFCVGIGDAGGATIPDEGSSVLKYRGEKVVTKLDNQTLLDIATTSGGRYIPLQTSATGRTTLGTLYNRHVKTIIARDMQEMRESRMVERFQLFLVPGLILTLLAAALSLGRPSRKRKGAKVVVATTAVLVFACHAFASAQQITTSPPVTAILATPDVSTAPPVDDTEASPAIDDKLSAHQLARLAQRSWNQEEFGLAASFYTAALSKGSLDPEFAKTLRFNAALASLKAGNSGKAAELFRLLAADEASGTDAAEGLGVALFRAADAMSALPADEPQAPTATSSQDAQKKPKRNLAQEKLDLLQDAAGAFQLAMRGLPSKDLRRRNLEAALAEFPTLRKEAHDTAILNQYGEMSLEDLIKELLQKQRSVYSTSAATFTNNTPAQIRLLESAAEQQRAAADIWTPLHQKILETARQSITNENELTDFKFQIDAAKDQAEGASAALANLDPAAMDAMRKSESTALQLLTMTAPPPLILAESIVSQSNALTRVLDRTKTRQPMQDQQMSVNLFHVFAEQYGPWLDQQQQQAQQEPGAATPPQGQPAQGQPAITPEARKEIDDLVKQTTGSHELVRMDVLPTDVVLSDKARINAEQALNNMLRIMELLPKPPQQQKQDQQKQEQDQQKNQDQKDQQQDEQKSEEEQKQDPQEQEQEQKEEEKEQEQAEAQEAEESPDQKEADKIMAQILEQEKQREEERRKRIRSLPPRVGERDW